MLRSHYNASEVNFLQVPSAPIDLSRKFSQFFLQLHSAHQKQDSLAHSCSCIKTNKSKVLLTASENIIISIINFLLYVQISAHFLKFYLKNQTLSADCNDRNILFLIIYTITVASHIDLFLANFWHYTQMCIGAVGLTLQCIGSQFSSSATNSLVKETCHSSSMDGGTRWLSDLSISKLLCCYNLCNKVHFKLEFHNFYSPGNPIKW